MIAIPIDAKARDVLNQARNVLSNPEINQTRHVIKRVRDSVTYLEQDGREQRFPCSPTPSFHIGWPAVYTKVDDGFRHHPQHRSRLAPRTGSSPGLGHRLAPMPGFSYSPLIDNLDVLNSS